MAVINTDSQIIDAASNQIIEETPEFVSYFKWGLQLTDGHHCNDQTVGMPVLAGSQPTTIGYFLSLFFWLLLTSL